MITIAFERMLLTVQTPASYFTRANLGGWWPKNSAGGVGFLVTYSHVKRIEHSRSDMRFMSNVAGTMDVIKAYRGQGFGLSRFPCTGINCHAVLKKNISCNTRIFHVFRGSGALARFLICPSSWNAVFLVKLLPSLCLPSSQHINARLCTPDSCFIKRL